MKYVFTKGERLAVAIIINQIEGVNRTDARLVSKIDEHLELGEVQAGVPLPGMGEVAEFDLADLEVEWIKDHINKSFEQQKMPPFIAGSALSLEDKLKVDEPVPDKKTKKSKPPVPAELAPDEELIEELQEK